MDCQIQYVPYEATGYFSQIILDYLHAQPQLQPFYQYPPHEADIEYIIQQRKQFPFYRNLLTDELLAQYAGMSLHEKVKENILSLRQENTFTVCTAHQPNLFTGYLYVIYKIIHAIRLAETLNERYPAYHFVPVYFMGSEDNDLQELGTLYLSGQYFRWETMQKGAVGRMKPEGLSQIIDEIVRLLPPTTHAHRLMDLFKEAYLNHADIQTATLYLCNALFGEYGLVIFIPDRPAFKQAMIPVFEEELLHQTTFHVVQQSIEQLSRHYPVQAHPREINLFYLDQQLRERIVKNGQTWKVLHTPISWDENTLRHWIHEHPEQISPNVMLRGIMQEKLLPNLVFIGGGGELSYWLELKNLFHHFQVHYPLLMLRSSWLWIPEKTYRLMQRLHITCADVFSHPDSLIRKYVMEEAGSEISLQAYRSQIDALFQQIAQQAASIDSTLIASVKAARVRTQHLLENLELKMLRAQKKKMHIQTTQIQRMHNQLFPEHHLQERIENFLPYYAQYGPDFLRSIHHHLDPFRNAFTVAVYA